MASTGNWCALAHQLARGGWRRALTHALAVTTRRNYQILRSQLGAGYGAPTATGLEAARLAARHDGLLLDHTYTAKAMAGLVQGIRGGTYAHQDRVGVLPPAGWPDASPPRQRRAQPTSSGTGSTDPAEAGTSHENHHALENDHARNPRSRRRRTYRPVRAPD